MSLLFVSPSKRLVHIVMITPSCVLRNTFVLVFMGVDRHPKVLDLSLHAEQVCWRIHIRMARKKMIEQWIVSYLWRE